MRKKILFGFLALAFLILFIVDIRRNDQYRKLKSDHIRAKSDLRQIYVATLMYFNEDEGNRVMPEYTEFINTVIKDPGYKKHIIETYGRSLHLHYKPGLKLSDVNMENKFLSIKDARLLWDGSTEGEFIEP